MTGERTISKELTNNVAAELGFLIVITIEQYVMVCFKIGSHETSFLWEWNKL